MFDIIKKNTLSSTETVDIIEKIVYEELKPLGFKKFGRTLHRFVSEDISQVIDFQVGLASQKMNDTMWVNIGIRVPECVERSIETIPLKKYYHEYECNIRSRLGMVSGKRETVFSLKKSPEYLAKIIIKEVKEFVIPAFDLLCSRESILKHRKEYPNMDTLGYIELDETMIYLKLGNADKAKEIFENNYNKNLAEYEDEKENGEKVFLKKGQRIVAGKSDITAHKTGCYTVYSANDFHLKYLDELAIKLNLR